MPKASSNAQARNAVRMLARELEAEFVGQKRSVRMAGIEQPRLRHRHPGRPHAFAHADRALQRERAFVVVADSAPVRELDGKRGERRTASASHTNGIGPGLVRQRQREQRQRSRPMPEQQIVRRRPARMPLADRLEARVDHRRAKQHRRSRARSSTRRSAAGSRRAHRPRRCHRRRSVTPDQRDRENRFAREPRGAKARERAPRIRGLGQVQRRRSRARRRSAPAPARCR